MNLHKPATRRHFTEAARAAAAEARRRKREHPVAKDCPEVFAVRLPSPSIQFGWEIRRYGALVLAKSSAGYPTASAALSGGELALSALMAQP